MAIKIQTIKDIRFYLAGELEGDFPETEIRSLANIIIRSVLGLTSMHQAYLSDLKVNKLQREAVIKICYELKRGKPIQYILGETLFYDCKIRLNSATLIPRPETEELVDFIINENRNFNGKIIDFGTGSGCIAIALAKNIPGTIITGTDISPDALSIAEENASQNNVKVKFILDDILSPETGRLDNAGIIVSNPPYVRNSEKELMHRNVLGFEPHTALFADDSDPLAFYRAILHKADILLQTGGKVYFEINEAMGSPLVLMLESYNYSSVMLMKDMNGKERFIKGIRNDK
jgi:release factor glutamine methyltransferase